MDHEAAAGRTWMTTPPELVGCDCLASPAASRSFMVCAGGAGAGAAGRAGAVEEDAAAAAAAAVVALAGCMASSCSPGVVATVRQDSPAALVAAGPISSCSTKPLISSLRP